MTETNRSARIDAFLVQAGWAGAQRAVLAGDASFRKYERVTHNGNVAVLMDAPPDKEDTNPFVGVAEYLADAGFSAPRILAKDAQEGFLLLEDLGDDLYSRVLAGKHSLAVAPSEKELYLLAAEVLVQFYQSQANTPHTLPPYDTALYMREVLLFSDWFLPLALGEAQAAALRAEFMALWERILTRAALPVECFVHRDFHADNLIYLPQRESFKQCGMLDFQDAVRGACAYDMVSFLEDARRDVAADTVEEVITYYLARTGKDKATFMAQYAVLGAQRNTKIIGIFCRLCVRDGKRHYLSLLPRVWKHLEHDMTHPLLAELRDWLAAHVPASCRGEITPRERAQV